MRKYLSCFLIFVLLCSFAGCALLPGDGALPDVLNAFGKTEGSVQTPVEETSGPEPTAEPQETEPTAVPEAEPEPEEPPVEEPAPEAGPVTPLSLLKKETQQNVWSDDMETWAVRSEYTQVTLTGEAAAVYPELAAALESLSTMQARTMEYEYDELVVGAAEAIAQNADSFEPMVSTLDTVVRRADSTVVSLLEDSYLDTGRIDGFRGFSGINFDTQTGKQLHISEVIPDPYGVPAAVTKELNRHVWAGEVDFGPAVEAYFQNTAEEDLRWTLDYNGVTFYFMDGDVDESGNGCRTATVSFAAYPELFCEKYMAVPDAYTAELSLDCSFFTDLDGDGAVDEQSVTGLFSAQDLFYTEFAVYAPADGSFYYNDRVTEDIHPYYMKTADGGHYLYLFCEQNDGAFPQMDLTVYDISGGGAVLTGEKNMGPAYLPENIIRVPTDPADLLLDDYNGGAQDAMPYTVGADGMPELKYGLNRKE